jgi:hypothetical protein
VDLVGAFRQRPFLVAAETDLATIVLTGAALMIPPSPFATFTRIESGSRPDHVLTVAQQSAQPALSFGSIECRPLTATYWVAYRRCLAWVPPASAAWPRRAAGIENWHPGINADRIHTAKLAPMNCSTSSTVAYGNSVQFACVFPVIRRDTLCSTSRR